MHKLGASIFTACLILMSSAPAFAAKRVALVIGNSNYQNVVRLANPANDAAAIAAMFRQAAFDIVDSRNNLNAADMRRALRDFGNKARDADVAVIYYAGHGIEMDNTNYLIPVDAQLETDTDVYDEAFALDRILVAVEPAKHLRLVILDACRDNPFSKAMKRTMASRAIGRGLAKVEPTSPNTIIAFAAKAGFTASDGDGANSPFAAALARNLIVPGLDLRKAFGFVRDDVLKATGNKQEPYIYGSLGGDDVALVPAKPAPPDAIVSPLNEARRDYELALQIGSKSTWGSFLNAHPSGFYADLAKGQLDRIAAEEARIAAAEKTSDAKLALLTPPGQPAAQAVTESTRLTRDIKKELLRVGCYAGPIDDRWQTANTALGKFIRFSKTSPAVEQPNLELLESIQTRSTRVCPLECSSRETEANGQCVAKTCADGLTLDDDGSCAKPRAKSAARQPRDDLDQRNNSARPTAARTAAPGDPVAASMAIRGPGTIRTGETVTLTSQNGRKLTCTGGDNSRGVPRVCYWN